MGKFVLSLVLTNSCNLHCTYCYELKKSVNSFSFKKAQSIIADHLNKSGYDEIEIDLFGGEPFLEFDLIKKICEWTWSQKWKNKYIFFATSNGTLIHGEIQEWLRKNKNRFWVSLSLDGNKESHNKNRSNSYENIDIPFFLECWPKQTVKMTISKETVAKLSDNIIYIHSLGFSIAGSNFAEGIDWEDQKYVEIVNKELEKLCEFYINNPAVTPAPIINMPLYKCEETREKRKWCGCGEHMAAYGTDGKKYPCTFLTPMTFLDKQLEELSQIDLADAQQLVDEDCFEHCYIEPVCNSCYGANLLVNGEINQRDKSKCKLMKMRAFYSAALSANKILSNPQDSYENKLTVQAIKKIHELYSENGSN